jgi:HNH endonuclease
MTQFYWLNIGNPAFMSHQDWWGFLRKNSIFAVGFEDTLERTYPPGKAKNTILLPDEGDIIVAYAAGWGPVGYGIVGTRSSYKEIDKRVRDNWRHQRSIEWRATCDDLTEAKANANWLDEHHSGLGIRRPTLEQIKGKFVDCAQKLCTYFDEKFSGVFLPEELSSPEHLLEGAKTQITVNAYERNPEARAECLKKFGYACTVCGFDFEAVYGVIGHAFIHVHHLTKLSDIGKEYVVNPITDLCPVCANCHAMIHRRKDHYTIKEVQAMISAAKGRK